MSKKESIKFKTVVLKHSLDFLGEAVKKSEALPIIRNVKLEFEDDKVDMTTTDGEIRLNINLDCECSGKGKCLIDHKKLLEIVSIATADTIEIEVLQTKVNIIDGLTDYSLGVDNVDEFIVAPAFGDKYDEIIFKDNPFALYYKSLSPMRSTDELQAQFTNIALVDGPPTLCASDKNVAGYAGINIEGELKKPMFFPDKFAKLLSKIKLKEGDQLKIRTNGDRYFVGYNHITMSGIVPTSKVPNYYAILPKKSDCISFSINKASLLTAIKKARVIGNIGRFVLSADDPYISIEKKNVNQKTKVPLEIKTKDKLRSFTAKFMFIEQSIALIDDAEIVFYYYPNNAMGAIRMTSEKKPYITTIVMPIGEKKDEEEAQAYAKNNVEPEKEENNESAPEIS